ncbi:MAG: ribokinase [Thermoleophilaceae bacterium]|nr:ribokinase [Thermoleophilaceae bacterium]
MRAAVIGHVEWTEFAPVPVVPRPGEIANAGSSFLEAAGGGAVAAVQLARLGADTTFFTALGDDEPARHVVEQLTALGVRLEVARRPDKPTRRAFTFLDSDGERTITTIGERIQPECDDPLPWELLDETDTVYFVAGGPDVVQAARRARVVVATARMLPTLAEAHAQLDVVVGSGKDRKEQYRPIEPQPRYVAVTDGAAGGAWRGLEGRTGRWTAAALDAPVADSYGCGDSFAAGIAYGLGDGRDIDAALALAARCGAVCLTGRGPYGRQLTHADL